MGYCDKTPNVKDELSARDDVLIKDRCRTRSVASAYFRDGLVQDFTSDGVNLTITLKDGSTKTTSVEGVIAGTFEDGLTVTSNADVVVYADAGSQSGNYNWTGDIPEGGKIVPPGSTPESTGGIGPGAWLPNSGSTERTLIELGYNPVGSFPGAGDPDVVLTGPNDAIQYTDGVYYVGRGPFDQTVTSSDVGTDIEKFIPLNQSDIRFLNFNYTITVGAGGDFTNINDALKEALRIRANTLVQPGVDDILTTTGASVEIRLLSGFVMSEQVIIQAQDLSFCCITSEDATVTVTKSSLTQRVQVRYPAFCATAGGAIPSIGALFTMDSSANPNDGAVDFIFLNQGARGNVYATFGCTNAESRGLHVANSSVCNARNTVWSGAGQYGIRAGNGSIVGARGSTATGCGEAGAAVSASMCQLQEVDFSGSLGEAILATAGATVGASNSNLSGAARAGILAQRGARVSATAANLDACQESAIKCNAAHVDCEDAILTNCPGPSGSVLCENGGEVIGDNVTATGCVLPVQANNAKVILNNSDLSGGSSGTIVARASAVHAEGSDISTAARIISALRGSEIYLDENSTVSGSSADRAIDLQGSRLSAPGVTMTGLTGTSAIRVRFGSELDFTNGSINGNVGLGSGIEMSDGATAHLTGADLRYSGAELGNDMFLDGATVYARNSQGGANIAFNTVTDRGIIYKRTI